MSLTVQPFASATPTVTTAYIAVLRANIITIVITIVVKVDVVILLDVSESVVLTINISILH